MKKALTLLLAATLSGLASAVTYSWSWATATLPEATTAALSGDYAGGQTDIKTVLNKVGSAGKGVYVYANGGAIGANDYRSNGCEEGTWTGSSLTLAGRGGTSGESAAIVLGGITNGTLIRGLKLTATISQLPAYSNTTNFTENAVIALRNGSSYETTQMATTSVTASQSATKDISIECLFGEGNEISWSATNNIVVAFGGIYGKAPLLTYTIDNITVQYLYGTEVPEPTALALLAIGVAGLALRRKQA